MQSEIVDLKIAFGLRLLPLLNQDTVIGQICSQHAPAGAFSVTLNNVLISGNSLRIEWPENLDQRTEDLVAINRRMSEIVRTDEPLQEILRRLVELGHAEFKIDRLTFPFKRTPKLLTASESATAAAFRREMEQLTKD